MYKLIIAENMFTKKRIILISSFILVISLISFIKFADYYNWNKAVEAAGGFPYQIGLTNVTIFPCFTTGTPPVCTCGILCMGNCSIKDVGTCSLYSEVSGTHAGGEGSSPTDAPLFLKTSIIQTGLSVGGQLIAGGMSPVLMDSGVLASAGGCSGCVGRIDTSDKIKNFFNKIYIALTKN
ncbi:MAG: hypothetical protein ABIA02_00085 [Candidatus Falkowbacteria bacterium]